MGFWYTVCRSPAWGKNNKDKERSKKMSAFIVNNRSLSIIARFMADCANRKIGSHDGLSDIALPYSLEKVLEAKGCRYQAGFYSVTRIHRLLFKENVKAVKARYKENFDEYFGKCEPDEYEAVTIEVSESNRDEWLSNLYMICKCYRYQCSEGNYERNKFYRAFSEWVDMMADTLAMSVVRKNRPNPPEGEYKPWDVF